jgi:ComF family protein
MNNKISVIHKLTNEINKFILDILFPVHCIGCKKEGFWICDTCLSHIKIRDEHYCPICERMITPDGKICLSCKNPSRRRTKRISLDGLIVASSYAQFPIANAVHLFKYRFVSDLHIPLGNLLVKVLQKTETPLPDVIIPVPLHKRRLRWRGFNQSFLLAKYLSQNLLPQNIISLDEKILIRSRYTTPQMGIKDCDSRQINIANAFSISPDADIKNKTFLLVDDIATTGSTIFECAKVLKNGGAKEVFAVVVARQSNDPS